MGDRVRVMLTVLAVDDEVPALQELVHLLRQDARIEQVLDAPCGAEALRLLSRMLFDGTKLDAVFLDVRMPGLDGLDFCRLLLEFSAPPSVIFVTAYEEFAVTAYELGALDYLLKPVRQQRLSEAIRRVQAVPHRDAEPKAAAEQAADEVIPVELGGRTRLVPRSSVRYAQAQGDYVRLHTTDGEYLVRMPLATLTKRWEHAGFVRIHRSTLVAIRHISEFRFEAGQAVVLVGDDLLPVSRRHTRQVRDVLVRGFWMPTS